MKKKPEDFSNYIQRLFTVEDRNIGILGNHVYTITIQVTEDCNLACTYCYQHHKTKKRMNFETAKRFIDILLAGDERSNKYINSWQTSGVIIDFIGGEPFLEIDLIDQISEYFLSELIRLNHPWLNRFRFNFSSNGTLFFEPAVQKYIKKYYNFISLSITIDGNKQLHNKCRLFPDGTGSYDVVHRAVTEWRKHQNSDQTKITISPENVSSTSEALIYLIEQEKYTSIFINCVYEEGWTDNDGSILYQQLKQVADYLLEHNLQDKVYISILDDINIHDNYCVEDDELPYCGGSGAMICLDPSGDIYPCLRYTPNAIGEEKAKLVKIGDIYNGFVYNEQQQKVIDNFSCVKRKTQLSHNEQCINCPIAENCGDCAAYSYEYYQKIGYRTTFHCITHVARVLAACYYKSNGFLKSGELVPFLNVAPKELALKIIPLEEYNTITNIAREAYLQYERTRTIL